MEHTHQWRATSKVFALVCECSVVYHDWLKAEIEKLRTAASSAEADELRAKLVARDAELNAARAELDAAHAALDEARRELERQAAEIANAVSKNVNVPTAPAP
jgi:DNA repair exonuclease SbcCD ATPase subunit